jgi:(p)ppGpp synthase/HD superfamily hydrolase
MKHLRAAHAAARWHAKQRRKGAAREPYINHLIEVAELVSVRGGLPEKNHQVQGAGCALATT